MGSLWPCRTQGEGRGGVRGTGCWPCEGLLLCALPLLHADQDPGVAWGGPWDHQGGVPPSGWVCVCAGAGAWSGGTDWGCDCQGQGHGREELAIGGRSPVEPVSAGCPGLGREMPAGAEGVAAQGRLRCGVCVCLQLKGEDSRSVFVLKAEPLDEEGLRRGLGRGRGGLACLELGGPDGRLLRLRRQEVGGLLCEAPTSALPALTWGPGGARPPATAGAGAAGTPVTGTVLARRVSCPWARQAGPGADGEQLMGGRGRGRAPHLFPAEAWAVLNVTCPSDSVFPKAVFWVFTFHSSEKASLF